MARIDTVCSRIRSNKESVVGVVTAVAPETRSSTTARDKEFESLYERYVKDVYRYTLALLRNPADAEDVTQTAFLNAYRSFQRGEEPLKPQNWLIKITHNACRTRAIRAARRPREVPLDDRARELALPEQERPNVDAVLAALGELPFNQRSALVLRELEGRTYGEIAEALGVSVSAVETLIFRARRSLRLKREAFRRLAAVPLPASLHTFGGGAAASGGTAVAGGVVAKVAVVAAALLAGGAGYRATQSHANPPPAAAAHRAAASPIVEDASFTPLSTRRARTVAAVTHARTVVSSRRAVVRRHAEIRTLPVSKRPLEPGSGGHGGTAEPAPAPPAAASSGTGGVTGAAVASTTTAAVTDVAAKVVAAVPVKLPPVQASVPVSVPSVSVPPAPAPDLPAAPTTPAVSVSAPPAAAPAVSLP
jgi:RNA polymerase sigma factor (sigma-70 family)